MRKILVVIDMQKDFIDGSLGTKEAVAIVPNVISKMKEYAAEDIFATRDTHEEDYLNTQEGRLLPVRHCIKGTDGWQLQPDIAKLLREDHIVDKPTFGSVELAQRIMSCIAREGCCWSDYDGATKEKGLEITLVGLCTDICVVSNALLLKAFMPEVPIKVVASCCAGVTPEKHEAALETMRSCQIAIE
jgi:nicotinamidase/pyrazinamidase